MIKLTCDVKDCKWKEYSQEIRSNTPLPPLLWGTLATQNRPQGERKYICPECMKVYFGY